MGKRSKKEIRGEKRYLLLFPFYFFISFGESSGLLADVSKYTAVNIEDVTVHKV